MARIISSFSGIPFSFTVHAHDIFIERTLLREKIRDAQFIRSISHFNKAFLENLYPRETASKIAVVHVGVPLASPPTPSGKAPTTEQSAPINLLCVAALKPYKGVPFLVEACRLLAGDGLDFRCDIIGTGPQAGSLRRAIANAGLGDRISLRGALPQHEVAAAVRATDIFVLPSVIAPNRQMEGIPVALMEAMSEQKPVVATSISGIPELIEHDASGLLVDPGNPRQLAEAIRRLATDAELRKRLGMRGSQRVQGEFSLPQTVAELLAIFDAHVPRVAVEAFDGEASLRRVHRGRDAVVYELVDSEGDAFVVKRHRPRHGQSRPPEERAAHEFRVLGMIENAPRPIALDGATVVMSRASGVPLVRLIRDARTRGNSDGLADAARNAGAWLARFHATTNLIHGDFWPGNVFVHDGGIEVIDFEGARPGRPAYDIDYFLRHAALYFRFRGRALWPSVRRAFLEGYGR